MATVNLGRIKFVWQGAYNGATAYVADDVVSYNGSSYICILSSTGNLPTNTTYWQQMSSAGTNGTNGTNGTDLGTVLTTQGDIVYRNATTLARLGAGTSGQVLTTQGAGANPTWSTVSSDFVKLASTTVSSSVTSISLDGYFTSDYDTYIYKFYDFDFDAQNAPGIRFRSSNSALTASNYRTARGNAYYIDNGATFANGGAGVWGTDYIRIVMDDAGASTGNAVTQGEIILTKPLDTSNYKMAHGYFHYYRMDAATVQRVQFNGVYDGTTAALSGLTFLTSSGNITRGTIKLYGIKN